MKNGGKCRRYFLSVSRSGKRKIAKKPVSIPYKKITRREIPAGLSIITLRITYHSNSSPHSSLSVGAYFISCQHQPPTNRYKAAKAIKKLHTIIVYLKPDIIPHGAERLLSEHIPFLHLRHQISTSAF